MTRRSRPLEEWAGDDPWRRFVAWLARTAMMSAVIVIALAAIWLLALPWIVNGYREFFIGP